MKLCDRPYGYSEYREIGGYVHASIQSEHSEPLVLAIFLMAAKFFRTDLHVCINTSTLK